MFALNIIPQLSHSAQTLATMKRAKIAFAEQDLRQANSRPDATENPTEDPSSNDDSQPNENYSQSSLLILKF